MWSGSDHYIICDLSRYSDNGKKLEESSCTTILVAGSSLENWGFWCLQLFPTPLTIFYTPINFQRCWPWVNQRSCARVVSYKLNYHVDHHAMRGCRVSPRYSWIWVYPCEHFQEYSTRLKTLSELRVEEVKIPPLDGFQDMLNTGPPGGEGVLNNSYFEAIIYHRWLNINMYIHKICDEVKKHESVTHMTHSTLWGWLQNG